MNDPFPKEANTTERMILFCYHGMGIKKPADIALFIGHKGTSEVYRAMKKYHGIILYGLGQSLTRTGYIAPVGLQ